MPASKYSKTARRNQLEPLDYVPLEPFRDVFRRKAMSGLDVITVARRMGVNRERAAVLLGMKGPPRKIKTLATGERKTYICKPQQRCTYDVGLRLCRALGDDVWPVEVGV